MEVFFIKALQLILCFALLVLCHEGGHFLFAKLFKVRVEKFCLFFDPWFHLFKWRPKKSETTYYVGWLPLGGYVKIAGMIDESMDTEQMKQPVKPWEFRAKPAWQRLLIMIGGVLVNFFLAFFIYSMVLFTWGETYVPVKNMTHGFKFNETAKSYGFRDGDIPLRTDTRTFKSFDSNETVGDMYRGISEARQVVVWRGGKEVTLSLPGNLNMLDMMKANPRFVLPRVPFVVDSVKAGSPAMKAGMRRGDRVVAFNGKSVSDWNDYTYRMGQLSDQLTHLNEAQADRLRNVQLVVAHAGGSLDTMRVQLDADLLLGVYNQAPDYQTVTRHYTFLESIPAGISHGWNVLTGYVSDLKYLFSKDGAKSVGSFGAIGSMFPSTWDWQQFWLLTAFISFMLGFINILPIPALDGGHAFFLLCEVITRRKPSDQFMERTQTVGMFLLLGLMCLAIFNDLVRFVF